MAVRILSGCGYCDMNRKYVKIVLKNILLFLTGYCVYLAIEITFRGYSFRLMGVVGGLALLTLSWLSCTAMAGCQLPLKMLAGAFVITLFELLSGLFALHVLHVRMWDYSGHWMSMCDGLICPLFSLFWFFLSGVGILFADSWDYYVMYGERRPVYRVFGWKFALPPRPRRSPAGPGPSGS